MRAPWRESKQRIMHVLASVSNILCVCVLSIIWLYNMSLGLKQHHMTSACSTIQRTPYKYIFSSNTKKQKSKTLDPALTLFGERVYVCMSGDKSKHALTHSGPCQGTEKKKRALQSTCDGSGSQHGGRLMPALWSRANIPSLIRYKQLLPFCLLSREN